MAHPMPATGMATPFLTSPEGQMMLMDMINQLPGAQEYLMKNTPAPNAAAPMLAGLGSSLDKPPAPAEAQATTQAPAPAPDFSAMASMAAGLGRKPQPDLVQPYSLPGLGTANPVGFGSIPQLAGLALPGGRRQMGGPYG